MTKQYLIDLIFEIGLTISKVDELQNKDPEIIAQWISEKLKLCGIETEEMGASWGVLK